MGLEINAMLETSGARMIGGVILILGVVGFIGAMFYGLVWIPISDAIWTRRLLRRLPEQKREEFEHLLKNS